MLSAADVLSFYWSITPSGEGSDRVERVVRDSPWWDMRSIPIAQLSWGPEAVASRQSRRLIARYARLRTIPPAIIVEPFEQSYEIIDGFHRVGVAVQQGFHEIAAYVPV